MLDNIYEERIHEIFSRYCLPVHLENRQKISDNLKRLIGSYGEFPVAFFGAGIGAEFLLSFIDFSDFPTVDCFLDNNQTLWGSDFCGLQVKNPESVLESGVKVVFQCTFLFYQEVKEQFQQIDPEIVVIDLMKEIYCHDGEDYDGYRLGGLSMLNGRKMEPYDLSSVSYVDIYIYNRLYETSVDQKQEYLECLISSYLLIRDFVNAFHFIDVYVETYGTGKYDLLKKEVELLLSDLQSALKVRETNDILVVLLDNLPAEKGYDPKYFPYLNQLAKEGTYYTNAYSSGQYTTESLSSIWRQLPLVALHQEGRSAEVAFRSVLEQEGYRSGASYAFYTKLTCAQDVPTQYIYEEGKIFQETREKGMLSAQCWLALTYIASKKEKAFFMAHTVSETHIPYYCGRYQSKENVLISGKSPQGPLKERIEKRMPDIYAYVDEQCKFYLSMLGEHTKKVIFADHGSYGHTIIDGENREILPRYSVKYHVPLILHGAEIEQKQEDSLFSLVYFPDLLHGLMDGKTKPPEQTYIQTGLLKIYNERLRTGHIALGFGYEIDGFNLFLDEEYKMVRNAHGECRYYAMAKETEEIHDTAIIDIIRGRFAHLFTEDECYE